MKKFCENSETEITFKRIRQPKPSPLQVKSHPRHHSKFQAKIRQNSLVLDREAFHRNYGIFAGHSKELTKESERNFVKPTAISKIFLRKTAKRRFQEFLVQKEQTFFVKSKHGNLKAEKSGEKR